MDALTEWQATLGEIPGMRRVTALGNNPDIDILSAPEGVWSQGGAYPWLTGATALELVSTSAQDAPAGTGARLTSWPMLDTGYNEFNQTVIPNGLTPVPLTISPFRIQSGQVIGTPGSSGTNVGDLILRDAGGGTVRAVIPAGYGMTRQAVFTVPVGQTLLIVSQLYCINRNSGTHRFASIQNFFQSSAGLVRLPLEISFSDDGPYRHDGIIRVNEKTDFLLRCSSVSSDGTNITAAFLGYLTDKVKT